MNQRGQSLVLSLVFLAALIGMAAIVVDFGSWYRADRKLQANADAAALAGAQELPADKAAAETAALEYATTNDGGLEAKNVKFRTTFAPNDTIEVTTDRPAPGFFAQLFGRGSVDVRATAAARAGVLTRAVGAAPVGVDWRHELLHCTPQESCWGRYEGGSLVPGTPTTVDFNKTGPGAFRLLNVDGSHGGTGLTDIEAWIRDGFGGPADINQWYYSDPGIKPNSSHVTDALSFRLANEPDLLFPVYDDVRGEGAGFEYHVIGWAVFHVTGFNIQGSKNAYVEGYFMDMVWTGIPEPVAGGPGGGGGHSGFGARAVTLVE